MAQPHAHKIIGCTILFVCWQPEIFLPSAKEEEEEHNRGESKSRAPLGKHTPTFHQAVLARHAMSPTWQLWYIILTKFLENDDKSKRSSCKLHTVQQIWTVQSNSLIWDELGPLMAKKRKFWAIFCSTQKQQFSLLFEQGRYPLQFTWLKLKQYKVLSDTTSSGIIWPMTI